MSYAIMRIEKIKTEKEAQSRYKHNFRIYDVGNANPELTCLNYEPVDLCGRNYVRASKDEIARMKSEGAIIRNIRKDAVIGYEVMLSYSYEHENMDVDAWVKKNVAWLDRAFNPPDKTITITDPVTGKTRMIESDNVKSVVVHMDEEVPHIHAYIVPIDEKGHLNARYYTSERGKLTKLQTEYADEMKEFGLKRGEQKSVVTNKDVASYHRLAKKAVQNDLPIPEENENVFDYYKRVSEDFVTEKVHHNEDVRKLNQKINSLNAELSRLYEKQNDINEKIGNQTIKLCAEIGIDEASTENIRKVRRIIAQAKDIEEAEKTYPDKEKYDQILSDYRMLADYGRKQRKEKERN